MHPDVRSRHIRVHWQPVLFVNKIYVIKNAVTQRNAVQYHCCSVASSALWHHNADCMMQYCGPNFALHTYKFLPDLDLDLDFHGVIVQSAWSIKVQKCKADLKPTTYVTI